MHTKSEGTSTPDKSISAESGLHRVAPRNSSDLGGSCGADRKLPRPGVDRDTGQAIPISETEWQERLAALKQNLIEVDQHDETPDDLYEQFMRNLDEERARQGRPPAFQECD